MATAQGVSRNYPKPKRECPISFFAILKKPNAIIRESGWLVQFVNIVRFVWPLADPPGTPRGLLSVEVDHGWSGKTWDLLRPLGT